MFQGLGLQREAGGREARDHSLPADKELQSAKNSSARPVRGDGRSEFELPDPDRVCVPDKTARRIFLERPPTAEQVPPQDIIRSGSEHPDSSA